MGNHWFSTSKLKSPFLLAKSPLQFNKSCFLATVNQYCPQFNYHLPQFSHAMSWLNHHCPWLIRHFPQLSHHFFPGWNQPHFFFEGGRKLKRFLRRKAVLQIKMDERIGVNWKVWYLNHQTMYHSSWIPVCRMFDGLNYQKGQLVFDFKPAKLRTFTIKKCPSQLLGFS